MIHTVGYHVVVAGSHVYRYLLAWWDAAVEWYSVCTHREEDQ